MSLQMLEIVVGVSFLAAMVILSTVLVMWLRFLKKVRASRQVNALEQGRTARRIFLGMFSIGVCAATAGLSLSLWSPDGLERITLGSVLISVLLLGGGFATVSTVVFLSSCATARVLYGQVQERDNGQD